MTSSPPLRRNRTGEEVGYWVIQQLTVEMEAAAFFAVARFRGVTFGQMLYGGDDVSGREWEHRGWYSRESIRESLFWLAAEACLLL